MDELDQRLMWACLAALGAISVLHSRVLRRVLADVDDLVAFREVAIKLVPVPEPTETEASDG